MEQNDSIITVYWTDIYDHDDFYEDDLPDPPYSLPLRSGDKCLLWLTFISLVSIPVHYVAYHYVYEAFYPDRIKATLPCAIYEGIKMDKILPVYQFRSIPYMLQASQLHVKDINIATAAGITNSTNYRWHSPMRLDNIENCYITNKELNCNFSDASFLCSSKPFSPACPSLTFDRTPNPNDRASMKISEKCQFLDIYAPYINKLYPIPVVVLLTGLNFLGDPIDKFFRKGPFSPTPEVIKRLNVVFVHLQYRQGVFGTFFENGTDKVKNFGIQDIITGLQWVKQNIFEFGGDSNSITIIGHGSGATAALGILTNPETKDLFHRVWLASGSVNIKKLNKTFFKEVREVLINKTVDICVTDADTENKTDDIQESEWVRVENRSAQQLRCDNGSFEIKDLTINEIINAMRESTLTDFIIKQVLGILSYPYLIHDQEQIVGVDGTTIIENPWSDTSLRDIPMVFSFTAAEFEGMDFNSSQSESFYLYENISVPNLFFDSIYGDSDSNLKEYEKSEQIASPDGSQFSLSAIRVGCPQYHFLKSKAIQNHKSPKYLMNHWHRLLKPLSVFMFEKTEKELSFFGIDMLHLLGTYIEFNPYTSSTDHDYARNLQSIFKEFILHGKISTLTDFRDNGISWLAGKHSKSFEYLHKICNLGNISDYKTFAKRN